MTDEHFCTCTDLECALNPNSPGCKHRTCDRCIRKCLKAGEIPSCFFKAVHDDTSGNDDWTYGGFVSWVDAHRGTKHDCHDSTTSSHEVATPSDSSDRATSSSHSSDHAATSTSSHDSGDTSSGHDNDSHE